MIGVAKNANTYFLSVSKPQNLNNAIAVNNRNHFVKSHHGISLKKVISVSPVTL